MYIHSLYTYAFVFAKSMEENDLVDLYDDNSK